MAEQVFQNFLDVLNSQSAAISAIVSGVVSLAVWFGKTWFEQKAKLKSDQDLESTKSQLRSLEAEWERLHQQRENELSSIRTTILSFQHDRNSALERRRVEAIDSIWLRIQDIAKFSMAVEMAKSINFDVAQREASLNSHEATKLREFGEIICKSAGIDGTLKLEQRLNSDELFINEYCWALYSAYVSIHVAAVLNWTALRYGQKPGLIKGPKELNTSLSSLLPSWQPFVEKYPDSAYLYLAEPLRKLLKQQLINEIKGEKVGDQLIAVAQDVSARLRAAAASRPSDLGQVPKGFESDTPSPKLS